jgi:hypothetical protein
VWVHFAAALLASGLQYQDSPDLDSVEEYADMMLARYKKREALMLEQA